MVFKKKVISKEVEEDRVLYVKEEVNKPIIVEKFKPLLPEIPIKVLNMEPDLTNLEKAVKHFGLAQIDIFKTKDYPDRIVFITQDGRKLTWPKN